MQFNCVDTSTLQDAQCHPELH
ncbi:hypothetical protein M2010_004080 [Providencia stuartii]